MARMHQKSALQHETSVRYLCVVKLCIDVADAERALIPEIAASAGVREGLTAHHTIPHLRDRALPLHLVRWFDRRCICCDVVKSLVGVPSHMSETGPTTSDRLGSTGQNGAAFAVAWRRRRGSVRDAGRMPKLQLQSHRQGGGVFPWNGKCHGSIVGAFAFFWWYLKRGGH